MAVRDKQLVNARVPVCNDFARTKSQTPPIVGVMNAPTRTDIVRLSLSERLALIAELWDSLRDPEVPVSSAQMAEIEGQLASFDDDRAEAPSWQQLMVELSSCIR